MRRPISAAASAAVTITVAAFLATAASASASASGDYFLSRITSTTGSGTYHSVHKRVAGPFRTYDLCTKAADLARTKVRYQPGYTIAFVCRVR